jgi:hypothetical protein
MDKHLKIGLLVCAALLAFGGMLPFITTPIVQTEAQAKYEADLNKAQSLRPFVYSSEPPQDWLDGCIDFQRLINQKYANARAKYNLRDGYLPPESSCRETWKDPAGQRQWHGYSLEQKQKSIWLDPVARQQQVRNMPELN